MDTDAEQSCSTCGDIGLVVRHVGKDQRTFWTSPLHLRPHDLNWLVPAAAATGGLIVSDKEILNHIGTSGVKRWNTLSNAGLAATFVTAGTLYALGKTNDNPHAHEAGLLSAEAAVNSFLVSSAMQAVTQRARPDEPHSGDFFGSGSSFPSDHAVLSWSVATVIAHEYPGWATQLLAYGTAAGVSFSRIGARKHFPSDVLIGSTLGFLIGKETYRRHHDLELLGSYIGDFKPPVERIPNPMHQGTTYVPIDSWVYAAYDRLAGLGCVPSGAQNLRPWTRLEFTRLLNGAAKCYPIESKEAKLLYRDLQDEFIDDSRILDGDQNLAFTLDSVYTRIDGISRAPLTDGFHFGKTITDDYGRPYQQGFNLVSGFTTHAEAGPFAFFVRGEYQHAPNVPVLPDSVRTATAMADGLPVAPAISSPDVNRFRLLESYIALNLSGWQLSFGKQSLWWGPSPAQDLNMSNNAEPLTMLRLKRVSPGTLPNFLGLLGPIQTDMFLGQLDGYNFLRLGPTFQLTGSYAHHIDPQPYIWGYKLSIQPTRNLQLGISLTTTFAGLGRPLTFDTWFHTFSSSGNAQAVEPGDRRTGFDFSYRVPGLRKWLILYSGSMSEDEPNPIAYPRRSAWNPGVYLTQVPGLQKLDLHFESAYTNLPNDPRGAVFYTNTHYANGYTNNGQIMGGWVGPEARTYQCWANYWVSGQSKIQFGARRQIVDSSYVGGGRLQDLKASYEFVLRTGLTVSARAQYERWRFPVLANSTQSNVVASFQITYHTRWLRIPRHRNQTD